MHQDGSGGRPTPRAAASLPRTGPQVNSLCCVEARRSSRRRGARCSPGIVCNSSRPPYASPTNSQGRHASALTERTWRRLPLDRSARKVPRSMITGGRARLRVADSQKHEYERPGNSVRHEFGECNRVCIQIANPPYSLGFIDDARGVWVDRDDRARIAHLARRWPRRDAAHPCTCGSRT